MAKLTKAQIAKIAGWHKQIQFYGTAEKGYTDSGFWRFLPLVKTKDAHDLDNPEKPLWGDRAVYLVIVFLYLLACPVLAFAKSRQMRFSWATTAFALWHTMTGRHRHTIYQTKKEDDAHHMITFGAKNPAAGRADFILQHLPGWLADGHVVSGRGNTAGKLTLSHASKDPSGANVPWAGSVIEAVPQGADQVRGKTPSFFLSDESAYQDEFQAAVVALRPAVAGGGRFCSVSTVDSGSAFNDMVLDVDGGENAQHEVHPVVQRALDIWGIEWPKGMRSWQTRSGTWVLETHYTADPAKDPARDGAAWFAEAVNGYVGGVDSQGWKTEMEIDYSAGGGDPVFPQVSVNSKCFVEKIDPEWAKSNLAIYAGYDYGITNPSAFEVIGIDRQKKLYTLWELYEGCIDLGAHANKIKSCPYWDRIEDQVSDWSLGSKTSQDGGKLRSVIDQFADHGIFMRPGTRGAPVAVAQRFNGEYWRDMENPLAIVSMGDTPDLYWEITQRLKWDRHVSEAVRRRKSNPDKMRDKDDHGWSALSYITHTLPGPYVPFVPPPPRVATFDSVMETARLRRAQDERTGRRIYVT